MKLLYDISTIEGKIAVMQHYLKDPAGLLYRNCVGSWVKYYPDSNNKINYVPSWDWHNCSYNYPAPEKKKVLKPWNFDNCPKGNVLVRAKEESIIYVIIGWTKVSVFTCNSDISFANLCENWEHSFDGNNWAPCGIEVEE